MSNILVIKHGSLGDIVQISGALRDIRENYNDKIDVLNGIAYNKNNNSIIVTGKWWPSMYELKIN